MKKFMKKFIKEYLVCLIIGVVVFAMFSFIFKIIVVNGDSMNNTYKNGDYLICLRHKTPNRGDVIICNSDLGIVLVKRIIGVEGDTIDIDFEIGTVKVNGEVLDEPYICEPTNTDEGGFVYPITVPKDCYFVMGDNRNHSEDSRNEKIGYIKKDQFIATVWHRFVKGRG